MRLFVAIPMPDAVAEGLLRLLGGVPGARWQSREQLHLTLRFIGEVDGREAAGAAEALAAVAVPKLTLELKDVGEFGGNKPRALWAGVAPNEELMHLQRKIETALQRMGLAPEPRKYTPHVTLARLKGTPRGAVMDFLVDHALYRSAPFAVDGFTLYESRLTSDGSLYVPVAGF
jgi:2'-5' RNA ligase